MVNKHKKILLCAYNDYKCENCGNVFPAEKLQIHRIKPGDEGGTYEHRNCKIVCVRCHDILSSAQRITRGISS